MMEFVALRPKTYSHLIDDGSEKENKKAKQNQKSNTNKKMPDN